MSRRVLLAGVVVGIVALVAIAALLLRPSNQAGLANPASVNCVDKGGTLVKRVDGSGGEVFDCKLPSGLVCEEWAFFRGECPAPAKP